MDFDSDSDGSHISATPPRDLQSPQPSQPFTRLSCPKSRTKARATSAASTISRPILRPKLRKSCKRSSPKLIEEDPLPNPIHTLDFSDLPFQILRPSDQYDLPCGEINSVETFPAGRFCSSKFASFTKIRRTNLTFESIENDSVAIPVSSNLAGFDVSVTEAVPSETGIEPISRGISTRVVKKLPNLIGRDDDCSFPAKRGRCGSEGNFVKLNLNGHGRKYPFKGKRKNFYISSGSRRSFKGSKRKSKSIFKDENSGSCDEGLILQNTRSEGAKKSRVHLQLIEDTLIEVRKESSDENLVELLKLTHGYDSFRDGQLEAIKMLLSGKSTMLVLPTGSGKSLCYQLPAIILPGVTLVVSPLVALMSDQLKQLPPMIRGGLLCSSQTPVETSETLQLLQEGIIKVLFISPERLLNTEFISMFTSSLHISLVVVDEAHCISEWSHNFRPAYMRLRASLLRSVFKAECILAMTATATTKTLHHLMSALEIPPTNLIQVAQLRGNLQLSVSISGENRMKDLLLLLNSSPLMDVQSIIIYCKFQSETELISKYLRDHDISTKSYHSGIPAKHRSRTQELFCSNKIRVVVATVAFGMGLDKKDVGSVIHYSLPESLEEYVQEIGRAGRDGRLSFCHLYLDTASYFKLRSLAYSDGIDEYAVHRFVCQVFGNARGSAGRIFSLVKESASRKFDMKEEVMLTILTQLELGDVQYLHLLPQANVTCILNFHETAPALLAAKDTMVAAILKKCETNHGQYIFDIPAVANSTGLQIMDLSNNLQRLKVKGEITYELKDTAYCYTITEVPNDISSLAAHITRWLSAVEGCKVKKIDGMFNAAVFAAKTCDKVHGCCNSQHTPCLQRTILDYFSRDDDGDVPCMMGQSSPFLRADIKVFLQTTSQAKFNPRAVARIMHGIGSPAFPSTTWSRTHFWGRYVHIDFKVIMETAKEELMNFVGKNFI